MKSLVWSSGWWIWSVRDDLLHGLYCRGKTLLNSRSAHIETKRYSPDRGTASKEGGRWGRCPFPSGCDVAPPGAWCCSAESGSFRSPRHLLCAICPRGSWCRGSVKCVTPCVLVGGQGLLPYRKCLVSVQPAQRLFYSCLAIHLSRCLRLLALVTVWGMQALRLWCTVICCLYVASLSFWG